MPRALGSVPLAGLACWGARYSDRWPAPMGLLSRGGCPVVPSAEPPGTGHLGSISLQRAAYLGVCPADHQVSGLSENITGKVGLPGGLGDGTTRYLACRRIPPYRRGYLVVWAEGSPGIGPARDFSPKRRGYLVVCSAGPPDIGAIRNFLQWERAAGDSTTKPGPPGA